MTYARQHFGPVEVAGASPYRGLPGGYSEPPWCGGLELSGLNRIVTLGGQFIGMLLASRLDRRHATRPPLTVLGETFDTRSQAMACA